MWYIHVIVSNLNWGITAAMHMVAVNYNIAIFLISTKYTEPKANNSLAIILFLVVEEFVSLVYVWLAYFLD